MSAPPKRSGRRRGDHFVAALLALAATVLYWSLRSRYQTADSLSFLHAVQSGEGLFHPHHLVFNPVVRTIYVALSGHFGASDPLLAAHIHNILWSAVAVWSMYLILRRIGIQSLLATAATVTFILSSGMLMFSTQAEVYIPASGSLVLAVLALLPAELSARNVLAASLLWTSAVLYHQTNALFFIAVTGFLLGQGLCRWKHLIEISALSMGMVGAAYLAVYSKVGLRFGGFVQFCLHFTQLPFEWGTTGNFTLLGLRQLEQSQIHNLVELEFRSPLSLSFFPLLFSLGLWHVAKSITSPQARHLRIGSLLWLCTYYLFFLWWLPTEPEFFIVTLVPLFLLSTLFIRDLVELSQHASTSPNCPKVCKALLHRFVLHLMLAIIAAHAFFFALVNIPAALRRHVSAGSDYLIAKEMASEASDAAIYADNYGVISNLRYYFERKTLNLNNIASSACLNPTAPLPELLDPQRPLLIGLEMLLPAQFVYGCRDGVMPAEVRLSLLHRFLDLSPESNHATWRRFRLIKGASGRPYLLVTTERDRGTSVDALDSALVELLNDAAG